MEAIDICAQEPRGELATINSKAEQEFIEKKLYHPNDPKAWIAGIRVSLSNFDEDLFWLGGQKIKTQGYTNWLAGEPNNFNREENCMAISSRAFYEDKSHGKWYEERCDALLGVLCQKRLTVFGGTTIDQETEAAPFLAGQIEKLKVHSFKVLQLNGIRSRIVNVLYIISFCLMILSIIFYAVADFSRVSNV
jgi:hypothetical protein